MQHMPLPPDDQAPGTTIEIDRITVAALRPFAKARDVCVARLVRDLVRTVVAEDLVDAVLDDGVHVQARSESS
jgi:hypothetical protein